MSHLNETQLVDALVEAVDSRLDAAAASHLAACASCGARVLELRAVLQRVAADDVPEPSPLFWEHFPSRVTRAIHAAPEASGWLGASRWLWGGTVAVALVMVMVMVLLQLPMRREVGAPARDQRGDDAPVIASAEPAVEDIEGFESLDSFGNLESDAAWAMVRAVAEAIDYEDVQATGLTPRAGSLERVAMELTTDERAELARLIEQDARLMKQGMKRTGASTP